MRRHRSRRCRGTTCVDGSSPPDKFASLLLNVLLGERWRTSLRLESRPLTARPRRLQTLPTCWSQGRTELKYSVPGPIADAALHVARGYLRPDALRARAATAGYVALSRHRASDVPAVASRTRRRSFQAPHPPLRGSSAPTLYAEVKRKTGSLSANTVRHSRPMLCTPFSTARSNKRRGMRRDAGNSKARSSWTRLRWRNSCAIDRGAAPCRRCSSPVSANRCATRRDGTAVTVDRDLRYQPTCRGDLDSARRGAWRPIPLPDAFGHATRTPRAQARPGAAAVDGRPDRAARSVARVLLEVRRGDDRVRARGLLTFCSTLRRASLDQMRVSHERHQPDADLRSSWRPAGSWLPHPSAPWSSRFSAGPAAADPSHGRWSRRTSSCAWPARS